MTNHHVFVNNNSYSVTVPLPRGASFNVLPGHGIRGDYFVRIVATSGSLVPLLSIPAAKRSSFVIHDPLGVGIPKSTSVPSQAVPVPVPTQAEIKSTNRSIAKDPPKAAEVVETKTVVVVTDSAVVSKDAS